MIPIIIFDLLSLVNLCFAVVLLITGEIEYATCCFVAVVVLEVFVVRKKLEQSIKGGG